MYYPGDVVPFLLDLSALPDVSTVTVAILNVLDDQAVTLAAPSVKSAAMQLVPGSDHLYKYLWFVPNTGIADGTYVALVSYTDGVDTTVDGRFLEKVQIGDRRVTGAVALAADVAKDATVAKASTTLQASAYTAPKDDPSIQEMRARLQALPVVVASEGSLTTLLSLLTDVRDSTLGNLVNDRANHEIRFYRLDGTLLQKFQTAVTADADIRTRV